MTTYEHFPSAFHSLFCELSNPALKGNEKGCGKLISQTIAECKEYLQSKFDWGQGLMHGAKNLVNFHSGMYEQRKLLSRIFPGSTEARCKTFLQNEQLSRKVYDDVMELDRLLCCLVMFIASLVVIIIIYFCCNCECNKRSFEEFQDKQAHKQDDQKEYEEKNQKEQVENKEVDKINEKQKEQEATEQYVKENAEQIEEEQKQEDEEENIGDAT